MLEILRIIRMIGNVINALENGEEIHWPTKDYKAFRLDIAAVKTETVPDGVVVTNHTDIRRIGKSILDVAIDALMGNPMDLQVAISLPAEEGTPHYLLLSVVATLKE